MEAPNQKTAEKVCSEGNEKRKKTKNRKISGILVPPPLPTGTLHLLRCGGENVREEGRGRRKNLDDEGVVRTRVRKLEGGGEEVWGRILTSVLGQCRSRGRRFYTVATFK